MEEVEGGQGSGESVTQTKHQQQDIIGRISRASRNSRASFAPRTSTQSPGPLDNRPKTRPPPTPLPRPSSSGSMSSSSRSTLYALRTYASVTDPMGSIPPSTLLLHSLNTMAIFDAYPKAKYHFLVMPRTTMRLPDGQGAKVDWLEDLKALMTRAPRAARKVILENMAEMAKEVEEMIRDEMRKTEGFEWGINVGFHAIPSMKWVHLRYYPFHSADTRHIHLHVISEDAISPAMKTKKHYNSFRPDLGFFIPLNEVERWVQQPDSYIQERVNALSTSDFILKTPLSCFKCDEPKGNIPALKSHLEMEFVKSKKKGLRRAERRRRGSIDDDDDDDYPVII